MLRAPTLTILGILVAAYVALALPAYAGPAFLEEFSSYLMLFTIFSIYIFHRVGIPGLLEHGGAFLAVFWLGVLWLVAGGIASLLARTRRV